MGNGFGLLTPAACSADVKPLLVTLAVYQVPIMIMAYLPVRNSLLASGYCCTPSEPGSMMPSEKSPFQIVSAFTMPGLVQSALPLDAAVQSPGCTEFVIDCRVSWRKPSVSFPCTKQPTPSALKVLQTLTHWARVVGGERLYFLNRSSLIQIVPP